MKPAAPQAPSTTHHSAKTRAKGNAAPAKAAGATTFDQVLANTVAARARGAALPRSPAAAVAAENAKTIAARGKASSLISRLAAGSRRADEKPSAERTAAEAVRMVAGQQHAAVAALPADRGTAAAAPAARRAEPRIQVVDLRTRPPAEAAPADRSGGKSPAEKGDASVAAPRPSAERFAAAETDAKVPAPAPSTPLARLREMTGSDLVRTVGLVVRDGGGEIRLTLKPESLGSVRIRLSIEHGRIEGKIVVDTPEARQAFEAGIDGLARALNADGFQTGSLAVSVSGGNANDSRQAAGLLGDTIAAARLRASDEALQAAVPPAGWAGEGDGLVNVFA